MKLFILLTKGSLKFGSVWIIGICNTPGIRVNIFKIINVITQCRLVMTWTLVNDKNQRTRTDTVVKTIHDIFI